MQGMSIAGYVLLLILQVGRHDFHVSVTTADYKESSQSLQITMKVFLEDLEDALNEEFEPGIVLRNAGLDLKTDRIVADYIRAKFSLMSGDEQLNLAYVGHELEVDICFIYLEISNFKVENELFVGNSLFFDRFDDQSNIVNIRYQGEVYSVFLDRHHPVKKVRFD